MQQRDILASNSNTHTHTHTRFHNGVFLATGKSDGKNKIVTN